jgi:uncharacterized protein
MRLEKEFVVGAPLERVWPAVKDPGILAACLPGADLQPRDDVFAGRVEATADGRQIRCDATLRAVDADEDEHVATILLHGRQLEGPAIGSATVRSRCQPADSSTRVILTAELSSSGHAHPGAGLEAAARELFEKAAGRLEERAAAAPPPASETPPVSIAPPASERPPASEAPPRVPAPLPAHAAAQKKLPREVLAGGALAGGAVVGVLLARRLLGRRRKGRW